MKRTRAVVDEERRVVPRWRGFRTTASLGELDAVPGSEPSIDGTGEQLLREKVATWKRERDVGSAADLVGTARVLGREAAAAEAAEMLVGPSSDATPQLRELAHRVLVGDPEATRKQPAADAPEQQVRRLRRRLADEPRNPIAWAELSRLHAILGAPERAQETMRIAVSQVRGNRFVLRSASRLFVHLGDPEEAQHVLRRDATLRDPWLLSAEIAAATVAGRVSRHIKSGRALLASGHHPRRHLTELASALATVEMSEGNLTRARKLFRASLEAPNDNSVAQAGWAARRDAALGIADETLEVPRSFEARAWRDFMYDDWSSALQNCRQWFEDEPFSKRPVIVGSHIALVSLAEYDAAETLLSSALRANPGDSELLNNLAVALADQGRLEEAQSAFRRIETSELDDSWQVAAKATEGLLAFRGGDVVAGRLAYLEALEMASKRKLPQVRFVALAYHAREEILAGSELAEQSLLQVERIAERDGVPPGLEPFVKRLRQLFDQASTRVHR